MSEIISKGGNLGKAAQVQDAILLSVAKVVNRFPGLVREAPNPFDRRGRISTVSSKFSQRPFDDREPESPDSPFLEAFRKLNSGPDPAKNLHRCHPPDSENFNPTSRLLISRLITNTFPTGNPRAGSSGHPRAGSRTRKRERQWSTLIPTLTLTLTLLDSFIEEETSVVWTFTCGTSKTTCPHSMANLTSQAKDS